jgi:hypothetical protein
MDKESPADAPDAKGSAGWAAFMLWPLAFLLAYVLSIGPMVMLHNKGHFQSPAADKCLDPIYGPLLWCQRVPVFGPLLDKYVDLWDRLSARTKK